MTEDPAARGSLATSARAIRQKPQWNPLGNVTGGAATRALRLRKRPHAALKATADHGAGGRADRLFSLAGPGATRRRLLSGCAGRAHAAAGRRACAPY